MAKSDNLETRDFIVLGLVSVLDASLDDYYKKLYLLNKILFPIEITGVIFLGRGKI